MSTKFTVFDKETAKEIKKILKNRKANFQLKQKDDDPFIRPLPGLGDGCKFSRTSLPDMKKSDPIEVPVKDACLRNSDQARALKKTKRKGRKRLTKEEKEAKKKNRTPEEQEKINQRMAKLRELRKARKNKK